MAKNYKQGNKQGEKGLKQEQEKKGQEQGNKGQEQGKKGPGQEQGKKGQEQVVPAGCPPPPPYRVCAGSPGDHTSNI